MYRKLGGGFPPGGFCLKLSDRTIEICVAGFLQKGSLMMMNVDVPAFFVAKVRDYHEFDEIKSILVNTVGLAYDFEEVGCDGQYHAVFWAGDRPAEYIDNLKASFDE